MERPHVFLLVGDCLRAASVSQETMPFTLQASDLSFTRCYSPGTWTRPTHASLYSLRSPMDHGVTRRGTRLDPEQSILPERARREGYLTAIFSENPTFGTGTGFHHGIDYVDEEIHRKLYPSNYAPSSRITDPSPRSLLRVLKEIATRDHKPANTVNLLYGALTELRNDSPVSYPHHGERVMAHFKQFVESRERPLFSVVNLLDTHNPHHAPPADGAEALDLEVSHPERRALHASNDDREFVLRSPNPVPEGARSHFDSWEQVFRRRNEVYRAQIRYLDGLIEDFFRTVDDRVLDRSLVLVTGDHGQLFGEEEMVGHQTSLHPHGIHVPMFAMTPEVWRGGQSRVDTPVSLTDVAAGTMEVVKNEVTSVSQFADTVLDSGSTVRAFVDGPTWDVERLKGTYDRDAIDNVCVRKVGEIGREGMVVYESRWSESSVTRTDYELTDGSRSKTGARREVTPPDRYLDWLRGGGVDGVSPRTSERLERLGYK